MSEFPSDRSGAGPGVTGRQGNFKTLAQAQSASDIDRSAGITAEPVMRVDAGQPAQFREVPVPSDFGRPHYTRLPKPKEEEPEGWPIPVRAVATIAFGVLGFAFPLFFVPAALIALSIFGEIAVRNEERIPDYVDQRDQLTASVPNWRDHWLVDCESPAEEAFLHAMVDAFDLVPEHGQLRSGDLTLLLQVQIPPYRADFMMGEHLIVEVDGAAYHSSPEAIARDAKRDEFLVSEGFTVLRIPAKVVLRDPAETARRVREALVLPPLKPKTPKANTEPSVQAALVSLRETAATLNRIPHEFSRGMSDFSRQAKEDAVKPRPKWLENLEFQRQLEDRVHARMESKREEEGPFVAISWIHMSDLWESNFRKEETEILLKEWDARAASVPDDPEFQDELSIRISLDEYGLPSEPDDYAQMQRRARLRWQEEGRLIADWPRIRERQIAVHRGSANIRQRYGTKPRTPG